MSLSFFSFHRSVLVDTAAACEFSTLTGWQRIPRSNSLKSSWWTRSTRLYAVTQESTGSANQSTSTVSCAAWLPLAVKTVECARVITTTRLSEAPGVAAGRGVTRSLFADIVDCLIILKSATVMFCVLVIVLSLAKFASNLSEYTGKKCSSSCKNPCETKSDVKQWTSKKTKTSKQYRVGKQWLENKESFHTGCRFLHGGKPEKRELCWRM